MDPKKLLTKFMLFKIFYAGIQTSFNSFAISYMKAERGVSDSQASMLLLVQTLGIFVGQFFFGRLCDRMHTHKKVFFVICALIIPVMIALYSVENIALICGLYFLFGFLHMPMSMVIETWYLDSFPGQTSHYGKILAAAATAYAILSLVFGELLERFGYWLMPVCFTALVVLCIIVAATTPDASRSKPAEKGRRDGATKEMLSSVPLMLFMLTMVLTGFCSCTYNLIPVLMENMNGSLGLLGVSMFVCGVAQIPMMLLAGKLKVLRPRIRVALSGLGYMIMALCFALGDSPWYLVCGACASGAAWGILAPAYRELVDSLAADEYRNTAQGLAEAAMHSVGGALSSGFMTLTLDSLGMRLPLLIASGVQMLAIAILLITNRQSARDRIHT